MTLFLPHRSAIYPPGIRIKAKTKVETALIMPKINGEAPRARMYREA